MKWAKGQRYGNFRTEVVDMTGGRAGRAIVTAWTHQPTADRGGFEPWPEGEANLDLVVAAPELLEACEALLRDHEFLAQKMGFQAEDFENITNARAAVAKAKGGGP